MNLRNGIYTSVYGLGIFLGSLFGCSEEPTPTPPTPVIEQNIPLEITSSANTSVDEGRNYNYNVHAIGGNGSELTYLLKEKPSWLEIIASSGRISGKAPEVDKDTEYPVEVEVSDGESSITQIYTLTAKDVYDIIVSSGESIQDAIDSADAGTRIAVKAGIYNERITINKPLTLLGATYDTSKRGYIVPADYAWNEDVESIINNPEPALTGLVSVVLIKDTDDVTLDGFIIQSLNAPQGSANDMLVTLQADAQTMDNIVLKNNVIGPNTNNYGEQNGDAGRMGLYIDVNGYQESPYGLTNSEISRNKIFGTYGDGNAIFIWGGYYSYGARNPSPMEGTIIENNEISNGHRSGIEIAGGISDLIIKDNYIHDFSGLPGEETNLKYGHGIVLIRGSSDSGESIGLGPEDLAIENNRMYNCEKSAIYTGPVSKNYNITGNQIYNNGWDGIRVDMEAHFKNPDFEEEDRIGFYDHCENVVANKNNIYDNGQKGINVIGAPTNGFVLNAKNNWWGTNSGGEIADMVSDYVDYEPWVNSEIWK